MLHLISLPGSDSSTLIVMGFYLIEWEAPVLGGIKSFMLGYIMLKIELEIEEYFLLDVEPQ